MCNTNILETNNNVIGNIEYSMESLSWRWNPVKTTANTTQRNLSKFTGEKNE